MVLVMTEHFKLHVNSLGVDRLSVLCDVRLCNDVSVLPIAYCQQRIYFCTNMQTRRTLLVRNL